MDNKKKNYFVVILLVLFVIYISFYIAMESGYYDNLEYKKSVLTKEAMEKFEQDLKENKDVSVSDYLETPYKSYSNNFTAIGEKTGKVASKAMKKGLRSTFKVLNKLFIE